jgi:RimJ/RimL family protein N-acetyltransferase
VPSKRNRGYARGALRLLLPISHELGLQRLLISCDEDKVASRRVIEANGGVRVGEKPHPAHPAKCKNSLLGDHRRLKVLVHHLARCSDLVDSGEADIARPSQMGRS